MESRQVENVYINTFNNKSYTSDKIYKTLKKHGIKTTIPENNSVIYNEDNFVIKTFMANIGNDNENSIITLVKYKNFETLFMGDAGIKAFDKIKTYMPENIEVLKVGHHGAKNVVSDEMLNTLKSEVSLISTGMNYFGHPAKGTLDILRNTSIYRTDKNNSIKITSDGDVYRVFTYNRTNHKYEINKLAGKIAEKGYTLVPLKVYIKGDLIKVEIGLARGKKLYDKRQDIAKKDQRREVEREFKVKNLY